MKEISAELGSNESGSFTIVAGKWYAAMMDNMIRGARLAFEQHGIGEENLQLVRCPGSFEIPQVARRIAETKQVDGIVCLGVLIQGETRHFEFIAREVTRQIQVLGCRYEVPITFGVLTCDTEQQAAVRTDPDRKDKGGEAARAVLELANLDAQL